MKIQEKTKNQSGIKYLFRLIIILGAILIFIAPLIHFPFSKENPEIENYKKQLNGKILNYQSSLSELKNTYNKNKISAENYIIQSENIRKKILKQEKLNKQLLSTKTKESRVLGWLTLKTFLVGFGIRVPYLLFSLLISFLIYKINTDERELRLTFIFLQIACYTIALYELVWCFWYSQDYPLYMYKWIIIGLSGLVATTVVYFISYRELLRMRLQKIVNALSRFIVLDARKHIKPEEEKEYVNGYIDAIKKSMK